MSKLFYPAIVSKDDPGFFVSFPDIPGCFAAGDTVNEVAIDAKSALDLHVRAAKDNTIVLNPPSELDTIELNRDEGEVALVLIEVEIPE